MKNRLWLLLVPFLFAACGKEQEPQIPQPLPPERVIIPHYPGEGFYENSSSSVVLQSFASAKRSLDVEIYMIWDKDIHAAVDQALDRGIRVRILVDEEASRDCKLLSPPKPNEDSNCLELRSLFRKISAQGGSVARFAKDELCGVKGKFCHQHGKMVIVDETYALISSGNFNPPNLCNKRQKLKRCNRDYSYVTYDPKILGMLQEIFAKDLSGLAYDLGPILANDREGKLTVSPLSSTPILQAIQSAQKIVQVENQYLQDPEMNRALMAAAQRGVKVEVTTSSACAFGRPNQQEREKITKIYSEFDAAGISSRMFTRSMKVGDLPGYLHAKALLIDQKLGWVGSINGSFTAFQLNREFGVFFRDLKEIAELEQFLIQDHLHAKSVSWQEALECLNEDLQLDKNLSFLWR
jgi:cardiolipin synthase